MERQVASPAEEAVGVRRIFRVARAGRREALETAKELAKEPAEIAEAIFQALKAQAVQGMAAVQACAIGRCREALAEATREPRRGMPAVGRMPRWAFVGVVPRAEEDPARWPWKPG